MESNKYSNNMKIRIEKIYFLSTIEESFFYEDSPGLSIILTLKIILSTKDRHLKFCGKISLNNMHLLDIIFSKSCFLNIQNIYPYASSSSRYSEDNSCKKSTKIFAKNIPQ